MTWIFAEDFEGCKYSNHSIELKNIVCIKVNLKSNSYLLQINDHFLPFTTPKQAQAAYEKIKWMFIDNEIAKRWD